MCTEYEKNIFRSITKTTLYRAVKGPLTEKLSTIWTVQILYVFGRKETAY